MGPLGNAGGDHARYGKQATLTSMHTSMSWRALFRLTTPVLMGYLPLGFAFGLVAAQMALPVWVPVLMSVLVYSGTNQFLLLSLWGAGVGTVQILVAVALLSSRHLFYGLSLLHHRFRSRGQKHYTLYALTDETFSLLVSLPPEQGLANAGRIAFLNQCYWVGGVLIGALAGHELPLALDGLPFALTALFIVLMVEQFLQVRQPRYFIQALLMGLLCLWLLPREHFLLAAIGGCLLLVAGDYLRSRRHEH